MPADCPLEISHGALPLASGRLLAPAATLPAQDRLGEQVLVAISEDGGHTWPRHAVVFADPQRRYGYFEQKLAELAPGHLIATAWTVTLGDVADQPDSFRAVARQRSDVGTGALDQHLRADDDGDPARRRPVYSSCTTAVTATKRSSWTW